MSSNSNIVSGLKHTYLGYFKYFHDVLGIKLIGNIFLAVLVGLIDGVGLALFIPLLQFISDPKSAATGESMGGMKFVIDGFNALGVELNLVTVLLLIFFIFCLKGALTYVLTMVQVDLRQRYMVKLRLKQIEDLSLLSYQGFLKLDAGRIQNSITTEVGKNLQAMIQFLASMKMVIILSSYIVLACIANWKFAILIIIGGALSNYIFKRINERVKMTSILISKRNSVFSGHIIQCIHTFKYLRSTDYFKYYSNKLVGVIREIEKFNRVIGKNQAITLSAREPVIMTIVVAVILIQVYFFGEELGPIILSLLLFYRALNGLMGVQTAWQAFMQNVGSLDNVAEMSNLMNAETEKLAEPVFSGFQSTISMSAIQFAYGKKIVLDDINLTISKNQTVAFVGESGSGKTTLANVLITLLKPVSGDIKVDGRSVFDYNINSFRAKIGYITQEPIIYSDTIFNNITFWAERTPENLEKFWRVINQVALQEFIENSAEKENTELGDNGVKVSGGQKQRISIARELYKDIEILVMDEATSALDSETENLIQSSIDNLHGKYTIIVIAHRLSTIKDADCIYLLENGEISAHGKFNDLIGESERFRNMVSLQNLILE